MSVVWQPSISHPKFQVVKHLIFGMIITQDGWQSFRVADEAIARSLMGIPGCPFKEELERLLLKEVKQ